MEETRALRPLTETFESWSITTLRDHANLAWFQAKDLAEPLGVGRDSIRHQVADLTDEDVRVISIHTNKGSRKATFVSESGALQLVMQSRKPGAAKLRKWVCDIAVKYTKGELIAVAQPPVVGLTREDLHAFGQTLVQSLAAALAPKAITNRRAYALTPVSARAEADLQRRKWMLAPAFLTKETGKAEHPNGVAAGLTTRCLHFCEDFLPGEELYIRYLRRGKPVTYISEDVLRLVHRNNWRRGQPNPMANDLFARSEEKAS